VKALLRLAVIWLALWRARRLRQRGRSHVYSTPKTPEEWKYGRDRCIWCLHKDHHRRLYTRPPCPGPDGVHSTRRRWPPS
jgi:hypothetical protein